MVPSVARLASAAGPATITVNSFLEDGTTPLNFVRFQITDSNGTVYGPLETAPPSGSVTFNVETVDDSTTFEIGAETPPACGIEPATVEVGPLSEGDEETVDVSISFAEDCDLGSISVYSYSCPDGIDSSATDYEVFRDGCLETVDGQSFQIATGDSSQTFDIVTGRFGISGRAPLVGLVPGDYLISQEGADQGDGTDTVVYCLAYTGTPGDSGDLPTVARADYGNDGVELPLDGERVACDFFAVPSDGDVETPTEEPSDDNVNQSDTFSASIEIHLVACPAGYDDGNFFEDCHDEGIEGRNVSIEGPGGYSDDMDTVLPNSPGPGIARFEDLAEGDYQIAEDIPGDTVTYIVYCGRADADDVVYFTYDDSTSESIWLTLTDGQNVVCDWYIIPDQQQTEDPGKISITKYTCPTGYGSDAYNDLSSDCTDKTDGVFFTLNPRGSGSTREKATGENGTGKVVFSNIDPGFYDVTEDVPGEFSSPVVWCNVAGGDWYQKDLTNADVTTFDVESDDDIRCSWFNRPEDLSGGGDGSLRIHKSICPDGLTSGYYANCYDDTLAGVTFKANGPGGYNKSKTTGYNGVVTFTDLDPGNYTITETPPNGVNVAVYVVVCTRNGNNVDFQYDDATGLRIKVNIPNGADVVCDWYNVPPAKQAPAGQGSITVIKFLCQGRTNNKYDWENECDSYGAGASFDLTAVSTGKGTTGSTGNNGKLTFSGLSNGAYELDETSGDWCHAEADHVDASGNVLVQSAGNTNVYVYNCSKQVNVLPSTGTGPAGTAGGTFGMLGLWGAVSLFGVFFLRRRAFRHQPAAVKSLPATRPS